MTFTVTSRGKDGTLREESVEAASRADCVAACRARGITPVTIREGRSGVSAVSFHGRRSFTIAICLSAAVVVLAAVVWWTTRRGGGAPPDPPKKEARPAGKTAKPAAPNAKSAAPNASRPAAPAESGRTARPPEAAPARPREPADGKPQILSVVTNDADFVVTTVVDADGKTNLVTETLRPQTFTNPMLQLIAAAVGGAYENELAPLPPVGPEGDKQLREALKVEVPDLPDDTDEVRRLKEAVRATREDMLKLLDQGISVSEIFTQHQELWNENVRVRREMKESYRRLLRDGDTEAAAKYLENINGVFRNMGIPEISADEVRVKPRRRKENQE